MANVYYCCTSIFTWFHASNPGLCLVRLCIKTTTPGFVSYVLFFRLHCMRSIDAVSPMSHEAWSVCWVRGGAVQKTNQFAAVRADKWVIQPFAKLLLTLVLSWV